jgi:hypothetical protein
MNERLSEERTTAAGEEQDDVPMQQADKELALEAPPEREKISSLPAESSQLLTAGEAEDFRAHWQTLQARFVDDPQGSVDGADELISRVVKKIESAFADKRASLAAGGNGSAEPSTEDLRIAMQRYHALFDQLLDLA